MDRMDICVGVSVFFCTVFLYICIEKAFSWTEYLKKGKGETV